MSEPLKPSPELQALTDKFVEAVKESQRQEVQRLREHIDGALGKLEERMEKRLDKLRAEVREEIFAIRREVIYVKDEQARQGQSIATMSTRLHEGEKRFKALEDRMEKVEGKGEDSRVGLAKLGVQVGQVAAGGAVGGGVGGGIVIAIMKWLGG